MMNKKYLSLIALSLLIGLLRSVSSLPNQLYVDVNTSYPVILLPLDENIWDISLYTNGSQFNFTFTGTQYELSLTFTDVGDYPFVINSTNVSGEISGTFLVRNPYYVTFQLYKSKTNPLPFFTNRYINNFAYITAEYVNQPVNSPFNTYDPLLEKFVRPVTFTADKYKKPVFNAPYRNGVATMKLYTADVYAFRLIDGEIIFPYSYSVPNITDSYGTNIYLGKFQTNGTSEAITIYLDKSDINPYGTMFNWILIILIITTVIVAIFMIFMIPEYPTLPIILGVGFIGMLVLLRIIILIIFRW